MGKVNQLSRAQRIGRFIYNREKGTVLGRTAKSWGLIFLFYLVAYTFLAGFFIGMISVFMYGYVPADKPSLTGMQSILSLRPGLSFLPRLSTGTALIQLTSFQSLINSPYLEKVQELFATYDKLEHTSSCPGGRVGSNFPDTPCRFPLNTLGPCANPEVALKEAKPCVYLRLNKIFGWLPSLSNVTIFPGIAIRCYGANDVSDFQLKEPEYYPTLITPDGLKFAYIPVTYFPFINQQGYQIPLAAVRFPNMTRNTIALVECKVYGLNDVESTTTFELLLDDMKRQS